ncbi:MAG TPA: hypothetical protein VFG11_02625, partial [Acidobacteriota bacterium]|nr:hypothetical protein [Acidobacteriota bacterium]
MKGSSRALVFWLTLGVLLPAVLSYSLHKVLSRHHGLVISVGQQTYRYANVEEAAAFLIQNRFEDRSQLKTTVWVPPEGQFYIFLKGIHREVYVDTKKVPALSAFVPCIARDPLGAGLHDVVIQFKKIPPNSTFEFLWSKDYAEPQPIPPDCLYVTSPPALVLYGSLIASLLAILARLNCILILLVAPAVLLYRRLAPPLPMGVALWILFALMLLIRLNGIGYQLNEG